MDEWTDDDEVKQDINQLLWNLLPNRVTLGDADLLSIKMFRLWADFKEEQKKK